MKIAALIARILLGLLFVFAGSNGLFNFMPAPPLPPGNAGQFVGALLHSHYFVAVAAVQLIGGLIMLIGRYLPLGLILLGPVLVNIILYHVFMEPKGIVPGLIAAILWAVVAYQRREDLAGIFAK